MDRRTLEAGVLEPGGFRLLEDGSFRLLESDGEAAAAAEAEDSEAFKSVIDCVLNARVDTYIQQLERPCTSSPQLERDCSFTKQAERDCPCEEEGETSEPPQESGGIIEGEWTRNARVGPFDNGAARLAAVFLDPNDDTRIIVPSSLDYGLGWVNRDDASWIDLDNTIISHDAHHAGDFFHIATQEETTGRVAYHRYNFVTLRWDVLNETVAATSDYEHGVVSITERGNGEVAIAYETDRETIGDAFRRIALKRRVAGVWSSALAIGDVGTAVSNGLARVIALLDNRLVVFFNGYPFPPFVASTPELQYQIVNADNSLGAVVMWETTGLLATTPTCFIGDYTTFMDGDDLMIALPLKYSGSGAIRLFRDTGGSTLSLETSEYMPDFENVHESPFLATEPMLSFRYIQGDLKALYWTAHLLDETWITFKDGGPGAFQPAAGDEHQCGPVMPISGLTTQESGGHIFERDGRFFTATLTGLEGGLVKFEMQRDDLIPRPDDYTWEDFLDQWGLTFP